MKTFPKISVVIPVYNASVYLQKCINSVLSQSFRNIEVLAIDDGSCDNSLFILEKLKNDDPRIFVFTTKHGGVSNARNVGLENAKGEFIAFVDADDWLEPTMLEELYHSLQFSNADWAICEIKVHSKERKIVNRLQLNDATIEVSRDKPQFLSELLQFRYDFANWNKLYRASIIRQNGIRFCEDLFLWEDLLFNLQYLHYVNRAAVLSKPLYHYRRHGESLYSRTLHLRTGQFNRLFLTYTAPNQVHTSPEEREIVKREMARMVYNHQIHSIQEKVANEQTSFLAKWRALRNELRSFEPGLFYYPQSPLRTIQGIKKRLLMYRYYGIVTLMMTTKLIFRPRVRETAFEKN